LPWPDSSHGHKAQSYAKRIRQWKKEDGAPHPAYGQPGWNECVQDQMIAEHTDDEAYQLHFRVCQVLNDDGYLGKIKTN